MVITITMKQCYMYCIIQGLCMCLSVTTVAAYRCNIFAQDKVNEVVAKLYELHLNHPDNVGVHLALGSLCHGLLHCGHPSVAELASKIGESWLQVLQDQVQLTPRLFTTSTKMDVKKYSKCQLFFEESIRALSVDSLNGGSTDALQTAPVEKKLVKKFYCHIFASIITT